MKIITGGQTGVDLAALEFAVAHDYPYGGYVPKGCLNEAGPIPEKFKNLTPTKSDDLAIRTRANVAASDATLILTNGVPSPGTEITIQFASQLARPHLVIDFTGNWQNAFKDAKDWLALTRPEILNIAGPRESEQSGIGEMANEFFLHVLKRKSMKS